MISDDQINNLSLSTKIFKCIIALSLNKQLKSVVVMFITSDRGLLFNTEFWFYNVTKRQRGRSTIFHFIYNPDGENIEANDEWRVVYTTKELLTE